MIYEFTFTVNICSTIISILIIFLHFVKFYTTVLICKTVDTEHCSRLCTGALPKPILNIPNE